MRLKHYLILTLTVVMIGFFQPFVAFLGNLIVIGAALAYVYSDLAPEAQDVYEQRFANWLSGVRNSLRGRGEARQKARMESRSGIFRLLRRKKVSPATSASPAPSSLVIEDAVEAEFNVSNKPPADQASDKPSDQKTAS
jgi:hypothetical protein